MKFLMFIKHAEGAPGLEHPKALHEAMGKFVEDSFKSGVLKDTGGLKRTSEAWKIRSKGGKLTRTDGPFAEAKEVVGGYALVETKTLAEAEALAEQFMELHRVHVPDFECECEVRPVEEF
ncbi:MAG TPA: YciI family protein [Vicinamibacterales bacterium]|nr:YciI family protein [Vicinamibacterales bacterium]